MKETKYLTREGNEIKVGDILHLHEERTTKYGNSITDEFIKVTEDNLPELLKKGLLKKKTNTYDIMDIADTVISRLSSQLGMDRDGIIAFLYTVYSVNTTAYYNIIYKKVAVELDKNYSNHIKDAENLYFVSVGSHEVMQILQKSRVNFNAIAVFRNKEHAKLAVEAADLIIKLYLNE